MADFCGGENENAFVFSTEQTEKRRNNHTPHVPFRGGKKKKQSMSN